MPTLPIVRGDVETALGVAATTAEQPFLDSACAAASVTAYRHTLELTPAEYPSVEAPLEVGADIWLGVVMLANRWFARRNSPGGIAAFADMGPAYIRSTDPDVAVLLRLDRPAVG